MIINSPSCYSTLSLIFWLIKEFLKSALSTRVAEIGDKPIIIFPDLIQIKSLQVNALMLPLFVVLKQ